MEDQIKGLLILISIPFLLLLVLWLDSNLPDDI
jgi:hypothetical protein